MSAYIWIEFIRKLGEAEFSSRSEFSYAKHYLARRKANLAGAVALSDNLFNVL